MNGAPAWQDSVTFLFDRKSNQWNRKYLDQSLSPRIEAFTTLVDRHAPKKGSLLDLGCGTGNLARALARDGHSVTGIDVSPKMIAECKRSPSSENCTFITGDFHEIAQTLPSYSVVTCSSVLEYMHDIQLSIKKVLELLSSNGLLVATLPHRLSPARRVEYALRPYSKILQRIPLAPRIRDYGAYLKFSRNHYSPIELVTLFTNLGFEVLEVGFLDPRHGLTTDPKSPLLTISATPQLPA